MRPMVALALLALLASCVTPRQHGAVPHYAAACATTGPTGIISAHQLLSPENYTTFRASEFTGCPGDRSVVVISWRGKMTVTNVDLSRNVAGRFFNHFHDGETISFTELDATTREGVSTVVFQFMAQTRGAI